MTTTRSSSLLLCTVLLFVAVQTHAGTFSPPETKTLSYRYTRLATSQTSRNYEYGKLAYTIDLEVQSYDRNRVTCAFSIHDLDRIGLGDAESAFPGTGTIVLNSSGTVVETTISTYLVQPDMDELNDFLSGALGDNDLFYRTTFFYIPSFVDNTLKPGDTLAQPQTPLRKGDNSEKTTVRYRLADTVVNGQAAAVYGKVIQEKYSQEYEQPYYTYHRNSDMTSEEKLWWSAGLNSTVLYESTIENTDINGVTGQVQQVSNSYTETYVRLELVAVK